MLTVIIKGETLEDLAQAIETALEQVEAFLIEQDEEVFEYDDDGYLYDAENDELFWLDFDTGVEYYYDEEQDAWFETGDVMDVVVEDDFVEDDQEVDFE
jgi:hypothetical protein